MLEVLDVKNNYFRFVFLRKYRKSPINRGFDYWSRVLGEVRFILFLQRRHMPLVFVNYSNVSEMSKMRLLLAGKEFFFQ